MEDKKLHVGGPNIGNKKDFYRLVDEIFEKRWLTNRGELVRRFESELANYLGVKHCITICNGTVALEIAIKALGLTGEVIIPSLTFVATAHALQWQGIKPVFCDIDRETYNIDPNEIEKHITPNTTAILAVHTYSRPAQIDELQEIARRNNLKLLFDAAHAFGCSYKGAMIGNFGDCEVFSFHATKFFNSFEGGAIATNSNELAQKIRLMQNFGFVGYDNVDYIGTNGKMTEICAAMGLVNLNSIDSFIDVNKKHYNYYKDRITDIKGLEIIEYNEEEKCNYQYIVLEISPEYKYGRDELIEVLHKNGIIARKYFWPGCHKMEPYKSLQPNAGLMLQTTEEVAEKIVVLPTGTTLGDKDLEKVVNVLNQ